MGQNTSSPGTYARSPAGAATMGGVQHKNARKRNVAANPAPDNRQGSTGRTVKIVYRQEPFQRPGLGRRGWGPVPRPPSGATDDQPSHESSNASGAATQQMAANVPASSQNRTSDELPPYDASRSPPRYTSESS